MKSRPRKCKACAEKYQPTRPLQTACSPRCAIEYSRVLTERKRRRELRAAREKLRTNGDWAKLAQSAFNAFIRYRDRHLPCISCGRHHTGRYSAGHYWSVGAHPELRFSELNVHKQCSPCNTHKSGNLGEYRPRLIEKIGLENVEWLEGPHEIPHRREDDFRAIRDEYKQKLKDAQRD